jgi:hypothetical protein
MSYFFLRRPVALTATPIEADEKGIDQIGVMEPHADWLGTRERALYLLIEPGFNAWKL